MAFSESLALRVHQIVIRRRCITEKKLFGSVGYMLNGHMLVGVWKNSLIVRLGPDNYQDSLLEPHVREFDITGKPMKRWVLVDPEGIDNDDQLAYWIQLATDFVETLPKKSE